MIRWKWLFLALGFLELFLAAPAWAQQSDWAAQMQAARQARREGNYAEAEKLFLAAIEEAKRAGPDGSIRRRLDRLAGYLSSIGQHREAGELYAKALSIRDKQGLTDPSVLQKNVYGLVRSLTAQKKYAQAELHAWRALSLVEQQLGPEHAEVATAACYLAEIYRHRRKYAEAEPLYLRSIALLENGPKLERPRAARVMQQYAQLLRATKRLTEAKEMEARAKEILAPTPEVSPTK